MAEERRKELAEDTAEAPQSVPESPAVVEEKPAPEVKSEPEGPSA